MLGIISQCRLTCLHVLHMITSFPKSGAQQHAVMCEIMFDCFQYLREHHEMIILSLFDRASLGWGISRSSMIASTRRFLVSNRASRESADQVWKHPLEVSFYRIGQIAFLQLDSLPWLEFIPLT